MSEYENKKKKDLLLGYDPNMNSNMISEAHKFVPLQGPGWQFREAQERIRDSRDYTQGRRPFGANFVVNQLPEHLASLSNRTGVLEEKSSGYNYKHESDDTKSLRGLASLATNQASGINLDESFNTSNGTAIPRVFSKSDIANKINSYLNKGGNKKSRKGRRTRKARKARKSRRSKKSRRY